MRIVLVPSAVSTDGPADPVQNLTTYLVDECLAVDAGSLGLITDREQLAGIRQVVLTHAHLDHIATLPMWVEALVADGGPTPQVHALPSVIETLRNDLFNGRLWPDFPALTTSRGEPLLQLIPLHPGQEFRVGHLRVLPILVDHAVPTVGLIVRDDAVAVAFSSDTGPTEDLWRAARGCPELAAVLLEATFPDELAQLAQQAGHHTVASFAAELVKLPPGLTIFAVHLKPRFERQVSDQLVAHGIPGLLVMRPGRSYEVAKD